MWRIVSIVAALALIPFGITAAHDGAISYYVQLIRGTDSDQPPQAGSAHVGALLAGKFRNVLKVKNYWELCRRKIAVLPGQRTRVGLRNGREVEIDLTRQNRRTVTAYQNGQLVDRTIGPMGEGMTLIGGNRDQTSVWFIVVRRDRPSQ